MAAVSSRDYSLILRLVGIATPVAYYYAHRYGFWSEIRMRLKYNVVMELLSLLDDILLFTV